METNSKLIKLAIARKITHFLYGWFYVFAALSAWIFLILVANAKDPVFQEYYNRVFKTINNQAFDLWCDYYY